MTGTKGPQQRPDYNRAVVYSNCIILPIFNYSGAVAGV